MSAKPMTPRPILRVSFVMRSISGTEYRLASMTLSRKCTATRTVSRSFAQSTSAPPSDSGSDGDESRSIRDSTIEPRLHDS